MWQNPHFRVDLVTITEEIFNAKLHFFCAMSIDFEQVFVSGQDPHI